MRTIKYEIDDDIKNINIVKDNIDVPLTSDIEKIITEYKTKGYDICTRFVHPPIVENRSDDDERMVTAVIIEEPDGSIITINQPEREMTKKEEEEFAYFLADALYRDLLLKKNKKRGTKQEDGS